MSEEAKTAGKNAARDVQERSIILIPGEGVRYTVPEKICVGPDVTGFSSTPIPMESSFSGINPTERRSVSQE
mgnify:CR=1 FL=1